ncbi:MAG: septum site-determining protein MinC [Anaerolineae bacterium]|jgi:septum site-determining protein MinC
MVEIKGTNEGMVISLGEGPWQAVLGEMETNLRSRASFFLGGRVALRVGDRPLSAEQLLELGATLQRIGMTLWAVEGDHPLTNTAARELGLETRLRVAVSFVPDEPEPTPLEEMVGIVVRRTLRSGQAIRHAGHVTLIGDVNPGAEIVAGGDIVVWGKLSGTAHAGAMGDESTVICALRMTPSQIRIGSHIARAPERDRDPEFPEIASVEEEGIVVERWEKKKRSGMAEPRIRTHIL